MKKESDELVDQTYVCLNSNGDEIELIPGGTKLSVTKGNLAHYIELLVNARIKES